MTAFSRVNPGDVWAVWLRHFEVYRRLWKMQMAAPLIEPVFMIFAFGYGIGSLIASEVAGVPYLTFAGAGVLGFAVISRAMFETAYGSYFRMVYQATFDAILATPVEPESLACAELLWATTKALIDALIVLAILAAFGAARSPLALLAPLPLLVGSFLIAAITLTVTAHVRDIDAYNLYLAIFFSLIFICGVWFPVDVLPRALRSAAWLIPVTSAVDLTRALLVGRLQSRHAWELLYLAAASLACAEWSMRALRRRMVV
ncbi:MAG TPA: ABC transporter permease [Pyrinomonadaceae bacterium]|jgi:lipooligosaccharide transport system permease protein|nr:ABC transporter permease [Pyrinomonadaceae bacterium]